MRMMTLRQALVHGRGRLSASTSPALDARLLLQHLLGRDYAWLIAHGDEPLNEAQVRTYEALLDRAAVGEPVPYLTGTAPFMGLDFEVTPAVLIPRPETEQLVEEAATWARRLPALSVVDVGTGSGCIAVSLARALPQADVQAVDLSADSLAVAARNAERHAPGRIRFHQGDLLASLHGPFDLVVANLPYVTDGEWTALPVGVKSYEPALALRGGPDGLNLVRTLLNQLTTRLTCEGLALLEIGWQHGPTAAALAHAAFPTARVEVLRDFAGHARHVRIANGPAQTG